MRGVLLRPIQDLLSRVFVARSKKVGCMAFFDDFPRVKARAVVFGGKRNQYGFSGQYEDGDGPVSCFDEPSKRKPTFGEPERWFAQQRKYSEGLFVGG